MTVQDEQFTGAECEQIIELAESFNDNLGEKIEEGLDPSVAFEAALLGSALFCCGAADLSDDEIVESFRETVKQAREMLKDEPEDDESDD